MEIIDTRALSGQKEEPAQVEIWGKVEGFVPAKNRVLIKRLPPPSEGLIARPEIAQEQAERGWVIAVGVCDGMVGPPVGAVATFSRFTEEKHFDDEGDDRYVLPWLEDIRGWHSA